MTAIRLRARRVEKPWGRHDLGSGFDAVPPGAPAVGEIWFELPGGASRHHALSIKYLFTSEPLSIQVHPDDSAAKARGHAGGKDEAWVVLDAAPGAVIGLGLRTATDAAALRAAALDGSITALIDWRPVGSGTALYSPAGTVHAIGAGLTIVEIQQNLDLTFRLYDYGSARPLHLDDAIAVAKPTVDLTASVPYELSTGRQVLVEGQKFVVERWRRQGDFRLASGSARPVWLLPLTGGTIDDMAMQPGEAWFTDMPSMVGCPPGSDLLLAYAGALPLPGDVAAGLPSGARD